MCVNMVFPILIFAGSVFLIMGILFLIIISIVKKHNDELYLKCTKTTTGIVDGVWEHWSGPDRNDMRSYYPIYKYMVDGKEYSCRSTIGTYSPNNIQNGAKTIYYNPSNPSESYCDKETNNGIIKLFKILGICFSIIGLVLILLKILVF